MSDLCARLHTMLAAQPRIRHPFRAASLPANGIYVLFEQGEVAHGCDRIVRIGTHDSDGLLGARLEEHFVKENKDRSVFRKNIGRALLNAEHDPFLRQWNIDRTSKASRAKPLAEADIRRLQQVERRVSTRIQTCFSFIVIPTPFGFDRHQLEAGLIALVAGCSDCRPSTAWLGLHSPNERIRESGLWQVQHLDGVAASQAELDLIDRPAAR